MTIFKGRETDLGRDGRRHGVFMTGAGTPPLCACRWQGKNFTGPILAEHIAEKETAPVNPILVAFREWGPLNGWADDAAEWLETGYWENLGTPEQIEHARKVLTRLANWSAS